jgi:signal transduction histidine kinase
MIFLASCGHLYTNDDLELVEELGRRAAMAVQDARLYAEAREALWVREEFLSIAAHEIRTPVTSIHLSVQGLHDRDRTSQEARRLFAIVEREDRRLSRLVDELLDLGRLRSGRLLLELRPVDLVHVVRDVADGLAAERARSGSELSLVSDAQVVGNWDRSRVEQVVANLLSNAIKFGQGKPIRVEVRAEGDRAVLRVIDQGMGIPEQKQSRIFEPFERAVRERAYGGLGLGLYIVHTIVEALGGAVRVQSAPGAGATFTVELPLGARG